MDYINLSKRLADIRKAIIIVNTGRYDVNKSYYTRIDVMYPSFTEFYVSVKGTLDTLKDEKITVTRPIHHKNISIGEWIGLDNVSNNTIVNLLKMLYYILEYEENLDITEYAKLSKLSVYVKQASSLLKHIDTAMD